MGSKSDFDCIIVGCGIAGASLAYFLSEQGMTDILILEKEEQPGYHATGRAAGVLAEMDPIPTVLMLKILGGKFLRNPPSGFSENPLIRYSGILMMFQGEIWQKKQQMVPFLKQNDVSVEVVSQQRVLAAFPFLSPQNFDGALFFAKGGHLDVNELLWSYLRHARSRGTQLHCQEEVLEIKTDRGRYSGVVTGAGEYRSRWIVDAAGAWAGNIRKMAGRPPIEVTPYRRTVITFAPPEGLEVKDWPFIVDESNRLYLSPESGGLLASPMDEDPMEPCDPHPDELVVAQAIDRLQQLAPRLVPRSIIRRWAGMRTFASDHDMVIGEDPDLKGFFWLAGQGGAGIATSPSVGRIAAGLITEGHSDLMDVRHLSPARFRG